MGVSSGSPGETLFFALKRLVQNYQGDRLILAKSLTLSDIPLFDEESFCTKLHRQTEWLMSQ